MGRNAQRRRAAKRPISAVGLEAILNPPKPGAPPRRFLSLLPYLESNWGLSRREARDALLGGEVNVNGAVWAYPEVPIDTLQINDQGNYRIMVEGRPDRRPPRAQILRGSFQPVSKYRPKDTK